MKTIIIALLAMVSMLMPTSVDARQRPHVVVHKKPLPLPPRPVQPIAYPPLLVATVVVPPLAILYDLQRRTQCLDPPDPQGLGGPGFDGKPTPPTNVMVSAWERGACTPRVTPYR